MLVAPAQESVGAGRCGPGETVTHKEQGDGGHEQLQSRNPRCQLHSADVLELTFPFTPEFKQTVTVQPDGYISLRGVDSILVQGQTLPQVSDSLRRAYGKILHEPVVDVELKDFQKPYFIVGGEVGHPGKYDLRDRSRRHRGKIERLRKVFQAFALSSCARRLDPSKKTQHERNAQAREPGRRCLSAAGRLPLPTQKQQAEILEVHTHIFARNGYESSAAVNILRRSRRL